jgi:membrane-associated phospholipid phosphatase
MRPLFPLLLACCLLSASPLYAAALFTPSWTADDITGHARTWGKELQGDSVALARQPAHWGATGWTRLGAVAIGTVLLYQVDGQISRQFSNPGTRLTRLGANIGNPLGDLRLLLPALGLTAYGAKRAGNDAVFGTAGRAAEAAVLAYGSALGGKLLLGRHRPDSGDGAHELDGPGLHGDGQRSLPSGHSAAAFAVASVVSKRHPKTAPFAYGAASLTAYARVARERHWASDVFIGAALGLWIGHSVAQRHPTGNRPKLAMIPTDGGLTLTLNWTR